MSGDIGKAQIRAEPGAGYLFPPGWKGQICQTPRPSASRMGSHAPSRLLERQVPPDETHQEKDSWEGLPLSNMIIYELHTGLFSETHDFEGIVKKLDYLADWALMPLS